MEFGPNKTKELITTDELADIFRTSKTSIYRLISKRIVPFYKIGGKILFSRKDVEEYVSKNRIGPIN